MVFALTWSLRKRTYWAYSVTVSLEDSFLWRRVYVPVGRRFYLTPDLVTSDQGSFPRIHTVSDSRLLPVPDGIEVLKPPRAAGAAAGGVAEKAQDRARHIVRMHRMLTYRARVRQVSYPLILGCFFGAGLWVCWRSLGLCVPGWGLRGAQTLVSSQN